MLTFFSTFIPGTKEIIKNELSHLFEDLEIAQILDGLIVYRTNQPTDIIKNLRFFNNSYLLLKQFNQQAVSELRSSAYKTSSLKDLVNNVLDSDFEIPKDNYLKDQTFRFVISIENQTQKINRDLLTQLEDKVITKTDLTVDRAKPDIEFIILLRSEGYGFLGLRLTHPTLDQKLLQKGQLRPELAHILCLVAKPQSTDVLLDPFSGYGSIPKELEKFPHHQIIQSDINPLNPSITQADTTNLADISTQSIDKIITDPPWGIFDPEINLEDLYSKMLAEFNRILKPNGILVLLIGQKELFENILNNFKDQFKLEEKYNILVSGKKTAIYKLFKL